MRSNKNLSICHEQKLRVIPLLQQKRNQDIHCPENKKRRKNAKPKKNKRIKSSREKNTEKQSREYQQERKKPHCKMLFVCSFACVTCCKDNKSVIQMWSFVAADFFFWSAVVATATAVTTVLIAAAALAVVLRQVLFRSRARLAFVIVCCFQLTKRIHALFIRSPSEQHNRMSGK